MKPIIEYQNYRSYIQDYFDSAKKRSAITWRSFAKNAGFASFGFLKLICQGKASLSEKGIDQVSKAMKLEGFDQEYFRELVHLNQAKTAFKKKQAFDALVALAKQKKFRILNDDSLEYFANWQNAIVRELAPHSPPNTKTSNIGRQVLPEITAAQVGAALKFLTQTGLLVKNEDGSYSQTDKVLTTGNKDIHSVVLRDFHKQMSLLAIEALDNIPINERNTTELVIGVSQKQYQQLVNDMADFRRKVLEYISSSDDVERVYCLQMNLFPLSHKIQTKEKK